MQLDALADVVVQTVKAALAPVLADVRALQTALASHEARWGDLGALRERVAVLETRAPVPGPAGQDGKDGTKGVDGADGLGFEDLDVEFDGDRTLLLKFARGDRQKSWPIVLPFLRYQGVFIDGKSYTVGDVVTWAGAAWHANDATSTRPGEGSKAWTLCVKKGRDGKDGGR